jgi:hypothetical protein
MGATRTLVSAHRALGDLCADVDTSEWLIGSPLTCLDRSALTERLFLSGGLTLYTRPFKFHKIQSLLPSGIPGRRKVNPRRGRRTAPRRPRQSLNLLPLSQRKASRKSAARGRAAGSAQKRLKPRDWKTGTTCLYFWYVCTSASKTVALRSTAVQNGDPPQLRVVGVNVERRVNIFLPGITAFRARMAVLWVISIHCALGPRTAPAMIT